MVIVENNFPRGGVANTTATKEKNENIIFGATQKKTKSESRQKVKKSIDIPHDGEDTLEIATAGLVNYSSLQDGMILMGIVKSVDQICVQICLPGRMTVKVLALSISDSYTKNVSEFVQNPETVDNYKPLTDLYQVGDLVYGKVMEVNRQEGGRTAISFSLKPIDVHSELVHNNIKKGFVFNGAIEEVQEHGYIIETGIKGLRCFLPMEKSQPGHAVGELVFMKVEVITQQSSATTIKCKEVKANQMKIKDQIEPNLDYLLPGGIVNFTVTRHLKDGLQGTLMNSVFTGYINEHNLREAFASVDDIEVNSTLSARILYVAPLTKFVYLSLNSFDSDEQSTVFSRGDVVENAAVHHISSGSVVVVLNGKYKGVISLRSIKANHAGNYDMDQIMNSYAKKSKRAVRILDYDLLGGFYVCSDNPAVVNEKVFTVGDISPGDIITANVTGKESKVEGYSLQIGKIKGVIERLFLSPATSHLTEKSKLKCRVLAINSDRNLVYLTNLPEYMSKDCRILTSIEDAKVNRVFLGTIVKTEVNFILVKFFNNIKGILYRTVNNKLTDFYEGQSMHVRILSVSDENIVLSLPEDTFQLGEFCVATVTHVMNTGIEILVESKKEDHFGLKAIVPDHLLTEFSDLNAVKLKTYSIGQEITACCIERNLFSIRDLPYFAEGAVEWKNVQPGDVLRSFIKNVEGDIIETMVPIKGYKKVVKLHRKMMLFKSLDPGSVVLVPEQVVYVKILSKETSTKTITVSAQLPDVWDGDLTRTGQYFAIYLDEIRQIKKSLKKHGIPLGKLNIGEKVKAQYVGSDEKTGDCIMEVENLKVMGTIKKSILGKNSSLKIGDKVECVVLWVDYQHNLVYLSNDRGLSSRITSDKHIPTNLVARTGINGKIMLKTENAVICSLKKGTNPLVYIPTRLHYNDFEGASTAHLEEGNFCKITFVHEKLPIAVLDETYKLWKCIKKTKRKIEEKLEAMPPEKKIKKTLPPKSERNKAEDPVLFYEDVVPTLTNLDVKPVAPIQTRKRKSPLQVERKKELENGDNNKQISDVKTKLPGVADFWTTDLSNLSGKTFAESSSDDEEGEEPADATKKKKKQTTTEKYKAAREEEARLRAIEEKYGNSNILPETTDQFDRLVLSEPNNSKNWINYMVFHLQAMEIDKAKAVGRRALKAISFREADELLNIWVALLNLELRYGTKEDFNEVLKESLLSTDQFKIYMRVLEILTEANKTQELVELIGTMTKKFKNNLETWKSCAIAFYKAGIHDRAEQMMHKALAVLPEREHVNTIVAFANLTHKYSKNPETAHALLDQVVTSYPKRVDVWSQLIDMLIKDNQIKSARCTLERAVIQKIPLKKMRTIFKKYMEFEERHGTPEDVEKVKALAANYIKNNVS